MNKKIRTLLVGIGGYGATYVDLLLEGKRSSLFSLVGAVDPYAKDARCFDRLTAHVPIFDSMDDFFNQQNKSEQAELVIIASPIHRHYQQCTTALENGANVLCEKPLVPTLEELDTLQNLAASKNKLLIVGFQHCYSDVILSIKQRILAGEFGRPVNLKCLVSWPRTWKYYARNSWAGKIKTPEGQMVYDSVISNATAHYIQNMLYLLGQSMEESATLEDMQAECYRANNIESFDTIALKGRANGAETLYLATHATKYNIQPIMDYKFEKARITVNMTTQDYSCIIHHKDGRVEDLGHMLGQMHGKAQEKNANDALTALAARINGQQAFLCTTETVRPFTALISDIFKKAQFHSFPKDLIIKDQTAMATYVKNLHMDLYDCFNENKLPKDAALPWAVV